MCVRYLSCRRACLGSPGPSAQLVADYLVHRFALGSAKLDQLFKLCGRSFSECTVFERGCIDVDVQCRAAQSREPCQYADAAVADDVEIAVFAGAARQCN